MNFTSLCSKWLLCLLSREIETVKKKYLPLLPGDFALKNGGINSKIEDIEQSEPDFPDSVRPTGNAAKPGCGLGDAHADRQVMFCQGDISSNVQVVVLRAGQCE